jgi:mannose/fructose/N-acetylgalactosamine-specific phosphotransferase system component IIC
VSEPVAPSLPPPPPPPPPPTSPASATASSRAVTALVLGVLGIVCCAFCAPFAWYIGNQEVLAIRAGAAPAAGEGWATAGKILGIIGSVLLLLSLIAAAVWIFAFGGMMILQGMGANH